jgi:hypothetical protein
VKEENIEFLVDSVRTLRQRVIDLESDARGYGYTIEDMRLKLKKYENMEVLISDFYAPDTACLHKTNVPEELITMARELDQKMAVRGLVKWRLGNVCSLEYFQVKDKESV